MRRIGVLLLVLFIPAGIAETRYRRIISLVPSITHELYLLGQDQFLVGCTTFCRIPEDARTRTKIGTVLSLNLERILSLKPDLVLAGDYMNQKYREKFKKLKLNTVFFQTPESYEEIRKGFIELGELVGKGALAKKYVAWTDSRLDNLVSDPDSGSAVTLCFLLGTHPLFWVAKGSYLNDCIASAGAVNPLREYPGGRISREEVIRLNPDVIIIADMGGDTEEEKAIWQSFQTVTAARQNRIHVVDPDLFCLPSIENFYLSARRLRGLISGESPPDHGD